MARIYAVAFVTLTLALGLVGYLYATARGDLQTVNEKLTTTLSANATLSKALDQLTKQRNIDDRKVAELMKSVDALEATFQQQEQALKELVEHDPEANDFLNRPLPSGVKQLLSR